MSGLMLVFMFIAISFMIQVQIDKDKMKEIAKTYEKDKAELNKDLNAEFSKDLKKWEAEITKDNVIVFNSPNVLFEGGESVIKVEFKNILNNFFPRYIKVLSSKKYKTEIDEIRIEGHTSNGWNSAISKQKIYLKNMKLSQDRANNVLSYCYTLNNKDIEKNRTWLEKHFRANGMAFAKLKYKDRENIIQDFIKSRRVEFRVQMKTEEKIYKILEASN
jgi:outer membrane protein OmpA-like peptidoglycan-associated protein